MAGPRHATARFRPAAGTKAASRPSRRQAALLVAALLVVGSAVAAASFLVKPNRARAFDLFYGSVFLSDDRAPVAVDLTNGEPTIRLVAADTQVSANSSGQLRVVPLQGGTLLLNNSTGEFNMVDGTGFVIKTTAGGVPLPAQSGATRATGIASGSMAYIVQTGAEHTGVYLVSQATVARATGEGAKVKPRAFTTMAQPGSTAAGANASANSDLWMLLGSGGSRTIRQLELPEGSNAGVRLQQHDHGTVTGAAAIGVADTGAEGSGAQVVGVADSRSLRVFGASGQTTLAIPGLGSVDRILAATNQRDRLSFLYHTPTGWNLVSAAADGTGGVAVHPLPGIGAGTDLAVPAMSRGVLYTMDTGSSGRIWRISASGQVSDVAGAKSYPIARSASGAHVEAAKFRSAAVLARGSRVIFNSPSHVKALTVFTDGSSKPVVIDKSAAVDLNASGGAAEITDQHTRNTPNQEPTQKPSAQPKPAQPVNNHIDCKTATQTPHIPSVQLVERGSRSVQLRWQYPLLDPQDCVPSTYQVSVKRLSSDGPAPPGTVTVQGQNGVNLTGLFPNTEYQIVVTAYINSKSTASAPLDVRTSVEGPAAPTNVHTTVDDSGNWTITWNSCGGRDDDCVPSANWTIIPAFCDGQGLSSPPQSVTIIGDPTQHSFSYTYQGNGGLLGRGLSFQVEGVGVTGVIGTPAKDKQCSYSWSHPNAAAMSLTGGLADDHVTSGGTTSATVTLHFDGNRAAATGGSGARFTYQLLRGGDVVQTKDATTATSMTFSDIQPGKDYSAQVSVAPPRHDDAAVTVGPVSLGHTVSSWPGLSVSAGFTNTDDVSGTLNVTIGGVSSANSDGETFDLADSTLTCGSTALPLSKAGFDPAAGPLNFPNIARSDYNGNCAVAIHLQESQQSGTLLYGGSTSPAASDPVTIQPPALDANFAARWDSDSANTVDVTYSGSTTIHAAQGWSMTLLDRDGKNCGSASTGPQATIQSTCPGVTDNDGWSVSIRYTYFGTPEGPTKVDVTGSQAWPTVSAGDFDAAWDTTGPPFHITLSYSGPANLGPWKWTETVTGGGDTCGSGTWAPSDESASILAQQECTSFSDTNFSVQVDSDNPAQSPVTVSVPQPDPTNATCTPQSAGISAAWAGTADAPEVDISVNSPTQIDGCSGWTLTLKKPALLGGQTCDPVGPSDSLPGTVAPTGCAAQSDSTGWQIEVAYTDGTRLGKPQESVTVDVTGSPP